MELNIAFFIKTDDPSRYAGEHCFGKPSTLIQLTVGFYQTALLIFKLGGHPVKGLSQSANFIIPVRVMLRDPGLKVASSYPLRSINQVADG